MKAELDLKVSRNYESSFFSPEREERTPVGTESYTLVIDENIRIPLSREQAEAFVQYAQVKETREKMSRATPKKLDLHPSGAEFFSDEDQPLPDPPEEEEAEEDDDANEDYSGTDDAGDGVGQY